MKNLSFRETVKSRATGQADTAHSLTERWQTLVKRVEKPIASLLLTVGLTTFNSVYLPPRSLAEPLNSTQLNLAQLNSVLAANSIAAQIATSAKAQSKVQPLTDGVYLYGQSPERDRIGSAYMVFEVNDGQVVGAFYMPRSSFDCFKGKFEDNQLALTIRETYTQSEYAYALGLESTGSVASATGEATPVNLTGYHPITNVNANDRRILSTCKTDMQ